MEDEAEVGRGPLLAMRSKVVFLGCMYFTCMILLATLSNAAHLRVEEQAEDQPGVVTGPALVLTSSERVIHLDRYVDGKLEHLWSTEILGKINSVSFCDVNMDWEPEIVVQTSAAWAYSLGEEVGVRGCKSLLIYENISGGYQLVFNETDEYTPLRDPMVTRARMIDFFGDGTRYMVAAHNCTVLLIGYENGRYIVADVLPGVIRYGLDVGDVNGDNRPDIVYGHRIPVTGPDLRGFTVLENKGNGVYEAKKMIQDGTLILPTVIDDIRIGDVDGDGQNEIVMAGCCSPKSPILSVWEYSGTEYREVWSYHGKENQGPIGGVDIGDVDNDGQNEIVTASDHLGNLGITVWEFDESKQKWVRSWEDKDNLYFSSGMLELRVEVLDKSGVAKIIGKSEGELLIEEYVKARYRSKRIPFPQPHPSRNTNLDVWPLVNPISNDNMGSD